jgi:hypothetical protein
MQSCIDGIGVSWPNRWAYIWSSEVPTFTSEPSVCFGCDWVRNTALDRKWSPPISIGVTGSACLTSVLLTIVRCLRYGSSDLSAVGVRSNCRPAAAGDHMFMFAPSSLHPAAPWTISIATRRVRSVTARLPNRPMGTMASSSGSAKVAPRLCTKVRRGRGFPLRKCIGCGAPRAWLAVSY